MTANVNRDAKAHPEPFEIYDFAPWLSGAKKEVKVDESNDDRLAREAYERMR